MVSQTEVRDSPLFANGLHGLVENWSRSVTFSWAELVFLFVALLCSVLFLSRIKSALSQTRGSILLKIGMRHLLVVLHDVCEFRCHRMSRSSFNTVRVVWRALSAVTRKRVGEKS